MVDQNAVPSVGSLIREDLQGTPGLVLAAAEAALSRGPLDARTQLEACLAALAAGEPKRAITLLAPSLQRPRVTAALIAWARQLDGNWYPGDVGAETLVDPDGAFVQARPGESSEEHLEQLVEHGPTGLFTPRTLLEHSLRNGAGAGVQEAFAYGWRNLDALSRCAAERGEADVVAWTVLAAADLAKRAGMPEFEQLMSTARDQLLAVGDTGRLALSHIVEGDWYAAPGSSPEALGWDLAPQPSASPFLPADLQRAAACYVEAESLLGQANILRLRASLALRQAMLAWAAGEPSSQRHHLQQALRDFRGAGDSAGYHLAAVHSLVADIDQGRLGQHALDLGGGWHHPSHGPVAETLAWAENVGSRSWCVGLGRLLHRCGDHWTALGSAARSRIAYLAALQLISIDPTVPSQTLVTAVAEADGRNNLATNALLRLERAFGPAFADASDSGEFAFPQKLEASLVLVSALRNRARGAAAASAADRMELLGLQLARATDTLRASLPPPSGSVPSTMDDLQAALLGMQGDGSLEAQAGRAGEGLVLMQHTLLVMAMSNVDMAAVLAPLTRAEAFQRAGQVAEADRWFGRAIEAAGRPDVEAHLLPLALISAQRFDEARTVLLRRSREIDDEFLLPLWLRLKDYDQAASALARIDASALARIEATGSPSQSWQDLLSVGELRLHTGAYAEARTVTQQAIAAFEDSVRLLLRDPERLDACDQPDVGALFTTLASTYLPADKAPTDADKDASFEAAELARSLSSDAAVGAVDSESWQIWQRAAAEYAATANRLLATLASATSDERAAGFADLDQVDAALSAAEHTLDTQDPGVLLRRTSTPPQPTASEVRRHLPEGTLLLEYLAVGDDLLAWAMTRDSLRPVRQSVRSRELAQLVRVFHGSCADGRAVEAGLAKLLVDPFADLLREHPRVVVVPFGPLNLVPFHALRLDEVPLGLTHVLSYTQRGAALVDDAGHDRPALATRPLVVGDPAFDPAEHPNLESLPGARVETAAVAAALRVPNDDVLVGQAATEAAVSQRLEACDLLHVASHAHLDELSPFASSLVLAGHDELTVADIAGLRFGTDLAVLTGCDTGRGNATPGGDLVGLTRSLLRSGVERVVVSLWPVDDRVAPVLMSRFYAGLAQDLAPAFALAEAQGHVHRMSPEQLMAAYVALGGDPDSNVYQRRGLDLDPDLRDEEEIPEPLGGDAERYWAPFIVVG